MIRRTIGAVAGTVALGLTITSVAAAATPGAATESATSVATTSAVLNGRIDPHGTDTDFAFQYGPTIAYGATTLSHSAGAGTKTVDVSEKVTGLAPGTVYHVRVTAVSASGTVYGRDVAFKTAGAPPSAVQTGPAVNVGRTTATPTGAIDPNGSSTPWKIQYGLTTSYGLETFTQPSIAPGFTSVPVSLPLAGLAPATLFHYRVVSYHGTFASYGADETFFTEPSRPASPGMRVRTTPGSSRRAPFRFTTSGTLRGGTFIPAAVRCTGTVGIRYFNGRRQLAFAVAPVTSSCTFSATVSFRRTYGHGSTAIRVVVYHRSNGYLGGQSVTDHVRAGR